MRSFCLGVTFNFAATVLVAVFTASIGAAQNDQKKTTDNAEESSSVVDAQDRPIAGARVTISRRLPKQVLGTVTTDEQGRFRYPIEIPTGYQIEVIFEADGFLPQSRRANVRTYDPRDSLRVPDRIVLSRPVTVAGRIVDADGNPFADAEICVDFFNERTASINGNRVRTDAEGRFRRTGLQAGHFFVRYESKYDTVEAVRRVGVQKSKFAIVEFEAAEGQVVENVQLDLSKSRCVLEGVLLDRDGAPIKGREVQAFYAAAWPRLDESVNCTTDAQGRFRFEGLPPGKFTARANSFSEPPPQATVLLNTERPTEVKVLNFTPGAAPPAERNWQLVWGRQNTDSIEAALSIEPHKAEYAIGDTLTVRVLARNLNAETVFFQNAFAGTSELRVVDTQGAALQSRNYLNSTGVSPVQEFRLAADEEVQLGSFAIMLVDAQGKAGDAFIPGGTLGVRCAPGLTMELQCALSTQTRNLPGRSGVVPQNPNPALRWSTGITPLQIRAIGDGK